MWHTVILLCHWYSISIYHDDVIKWKHFPGFINALLGCSLGLWFCFRASEITLKDKGQICRSQTSTRNTSAQVKHIIRGMLYIFMYSILRHSCASVMSSVYNKRVSGLNALQVHANIRLSKDALLSKSVCEITYKSWTRRRFHNITLSSHKQRNDHSNHDLTVRYTDWSGEQQITYQNFALLRLCEGKPSVTRGVS